MSWIFVRKLSRAFRLIWEPLIKSAALIVYTIRDSEPHFRGKSLHISEYSHNDRGELVPSPTRSLQSHAQDVAPLNSSGDEIKKSLAINSESYNDIIIVHGGRRLRSFNVYAKTHATVHLFIYAAKCIMKRIANYLGSHNDRVYIIIQR